MIYRGGGVLVILAAATEGGLATAISTPFIVTTLDVQLTW
jgi:hypothetical protein